MATEEKNLSKVEDDNLLSAENLTFGIVVSEWNKDITDKLCEGARDTLLKYGAFEDDIFIKYVPGSFELTKGAKLFIDYKIVDAIIAIGCVIRGETPHFDYICQSVTAGLTELNVVTDIPVIFGVLTVDNMQQALDRAGGKHGNKGVEAAVTAIKMAELENEFINETDDLDIPDDDDFDPDDIYDEIDRDDIFNA